MVQEKKKEAINLVLLMPVGIVGKFGANAQSVLKKAASLSIEKICPLHGPVLDSDINTYLNYYNIWTNYDVESEGVFIAYTSVYGHTKQAAEKLAQILKDKGRQNFCFSSGLLVQISC